MSGGRPTNYLPGHCERVVELGKQGKSVVQMACELGVHKDSLYEWAKIYPEFSDAFTYARQCSQAWWEDTGQTNLATSGFSASLWSRSMAARFPADYTERKHTELTGANGGPVVTEFRSERVIVKPSDPNG